MSAIVLSAAVRQNLLSLQQTASALSQTQNNLSTGNKVNSALDNPTNFFTAQGLNNRASDISNLLDGISNGVQVIQAASTGITSLEKLVGQAKSVANQALQSPIGYSQKSSVTSSVITNSNGQAITASDLRGAGTVNTATLTGTAINRISNSTLLSTLGIASTDIVKIQGQDFSFSNSSGAKTGTNLDPTVTTLGDFISAVSANTGGTPAVGGVFSGAINLGQAAGLSLSNTAGTPLTKLGLNNPIQLGISESGSVLFDSNSTVTASTALSNGAIGLSQFDDLTVNGKTVTFTTSGSNSFSANGATINVSSATLQDILTAVDTITGTTQASTITGNAIALNGGSKNLTLTGSALRLLGLSATPGPGASVSVPGGSQTLSFGSVGGGTATTVTFGDGSNGTVKTLDQLNAALAADNLQASVSTSGQLTITTTNDAASASIGTIGGTAFSNATGAFHNKVTTSPVVDIAAQDTRTNLISQYNAILAQIDTTAADASYNGINLLNGDQLELNFNESGKSKLSITGQAFNSAGLGLASLVSGTDFVDNAATNKVLATLNTVTTKLRSQASALGSNLSVVQNRQDFNKNLVNVLQTGSANLTQADINLEAANSQALNTRQSLSVSALSLANQSQQSVLQLLR